MGRDAKGAGHAGGAGSGPPSQGLPWSSPAGRGLGSPAQLRGALLVGGQNRETEQGREAPRTGDPGAEPPLAGSAGAVGTVWGERPRGPELAGQADEDRQLWAPSPGALHQMLILKGKMVTLNPADAMSSKGQTSLSPGAQMPQALWARGGSLTLGRLPQSWVPPELPPLGGQVGDTSSSRSHLSW